MLTYSLTGVGKICYLIHSVLQCECSLKFRGDIRSMLNIVRGVVSSFSFFHFKS